MVRMWMAVAALAAAGAAPAAAWTPPKAKEEPKPRDCPEVGPGYVRLAGSSTCVRLGGLVRVEASRIGGSR